MVVKVPAPVRVAVLNAAAPETVVAAAVSSVPLLRVTAESASVPLAVRVAPLMVKGPVIDDGPPSVRLPGPLIVMASSLRNCLACWPAMLMLTIGSTAPRSTITMSAAVGTRF